MSNLKSGDIAQTFDYTRSIFVNLETTGIWRGKDLARVKSLINEIDRLRRTGYTHPSDHERWAALVRSFLEEMFGEDERIYQDFVSLDWGRNRDYTVSAEALEFSSDRAELARDAMMQDAYEFDLDCAKGLLQAAEQEIAVRNFLSWRMGKAWSAFKSVPPLQLKIIAGIIAIAFLLAAGFTIHQIVDLAGLVKKAY